MDYLYYPEAMHSIVKKQPVSVDPSAVVLDIQPAASLSRRGGGPSNQIAAFGSSTCHYDGGDSDEKLSNKQRDEIVADQQFHALLGVAVVCLMIVILLVVGLAMT
jgi:hypothetical protein